MNVASLLRSSRVVRLLLLLAVFHSSGLAAGEDPFSWLQRMSAAMNQMNYQGTFVYIQGPGEVETMRLTHVVDDSGVRERLVSLSGKPREVVRKDDHVRWISGVEQSVVADADVARPIFPELPLDDPRQASKSYEFRLQGVERIAGHAGRRLNIIPRDRYRYGYSLWLEKHSGLLLQWIQSGEDGEVLAQLLFTELKMGSQVNRAELGAAGRSGSATPPQRQAAETRAVTLNPDWAPRDLPPGFRLASHRQQVQEGGVVEHLVYSDGIATVSVYVEAAGEQPILAPGLSRLGTTHAFSRLEQGSVVTVVGDVPARTVKQIGEAVNLLARADAPARKG